ncbi:MAG: ferritin-like domain-containing protein [Deltaproteobacteria bacterium]|nr:ferritin-like domain-containing protein [Deltaproteobacteria bacterium]
MTELALEALGGMWGKRLDRRRTGLEDVDWSDVAREATPELVLAARSVWTQSAFSEYASAASFAQIATHLLAARAPIDLVAAAGDFVADEILHVDLASRVAMALGGAVPLDVDLEKLARPPTAERPLLRAAELVVRTSCVGEALTVPLLKETKRTAGSKTIEAVVTRIIRDEAQHAQLGWWFLDWAELTDDDRAHLGAVAGSTIRSFSALFERDCARQEGLGALSCPRFDRTFLDALASEVVAPLAERGIVVPPADVLRVESATLR